MLQTIHDKLIVTHTTIGLRQGKCLIELIAIFVFNNNLNGEATTTDTYLRHSDRHILWHLHLTIAIAIIFCIHTIESTFGVEFLTHQLLLGNIHITEVCQSRNTKFAIAIVVERTIRNLKIVHFVLVLT